MNQKNQRTWEELAANPHLNGPFEKLVAMPFGKRCLNVAVGTLAVLLSIMAIDLAFYFHASKMKAEAERLANLFLSSSKRNEQLASSGLRIHPQVLEQWRTIEQKNGTLLSYRISGSLSDLSGSICTVRYETHRSKHQTKGELLIINSKFSTASETPIESHRK